MASEECKRMAAELVRRSTEEQGLPLRITDPAVLAKIAVLLRGAPRERR